MSRLFYHVMQDNVGNLLFDVSGTMRLAGTARRRHLRQRSPQRDPAEPDDQSPKFRLV